MAMRHVFCKIKRVLCLYVAVIVCLAGIFGPAGVAFADDAAKGEEDSPGTFYAASTAITSFASRVMSGGGNDKHGSGNIDEFNKADVGDAGAVVGYGDKDKTKFSEGIMSNESHASTTSSYDGWYKLGGSRNIYKYVRYGRLLSDLGYDSVGSMGMNIMRFVGGGIITVCYYLSKLTSQVFGLLVGLLRRLNPFQLMKGAGGLWSSSSFWNSDMTPEAPVAQEDGTYVSGTGGTPLMEVGSDRLASPPAALEPLVTTFQDIVGGLQTLSWQVIIPMMFILMLVSLLLARGNASHKVLTFVKRVVLITVGIPFFGMLYTTIITSPTFEKDLETPQTSMVVANTFVDFADLVSRRRLQLPSGVSLTSEGDASSASEAGGHAANDTLRHTRLNAMRINDAVIEGGIPGAKPEDYFRSGSISGGDVDQIELSGGTVGATGPVSDLTGKVNYADENEGTSEKLVTLLTSYTKGDFYSAGAWTGLVTAELKYHAERSGSDYSMGQLSTGSGGDDSNKKTVGGMWQTTSDEEAWMNRPLEQNRRITGAAGEKEMADEIQWAGTSCNVYDCGSDFGIVASSDDTVVTYSGSGADAGGYPGNSGGLSAMAMYNYLNTQFGSSQVTVFSADASSSNYVRATHYAVSMVGSGLMRVIFWLNCFACVGVIGVVGLVFTLSMVINNLKRSISVIVAIPGAYLGVIKSMGQFIVYVILMILEFLGTVLMYHLFSELLAAVAGIAETVAFGLEQGAYATIIGGEFAFVSDVQVAVYNTKASFMIGILLAGLFVLFIGAYAMKCRVQIMYAYNWCWTKFYRFATFREALDWYDDVVAGRSHRHGNVGRLLPQPLAACMMHLL